MNKNMTPSPCLTCTRVADPKDCENKQCKPWSQWFLSRWDLIHGYYLNCAALRQEEDCK